MPVEQLGSSDTRYLSIIGGKLAQKVQEGTEWAVKREYDVDGNKWVKWELNYKNLSWFITNMVFKETDYWEMLMLTVEQDWETDILTMNVKSRYFSDFARKLPNIDLNEVVELNPYDFESNGKQLRGLSIKQDWQKIQDNYYDWDKKKSLNGMPEVDKKELKEEWKSYWEGYFMIVNKFLKKEVKKVEVPTGIDTGSKKVEGGETPIWELDISDQPF